MIGGITAYFPTFDFEFYIYVVRDIKPKGYIPIPKFFTKENHWRKQIIILTKYKVFISSFLTRINRSWEYFGSSVASKLRSKKLVL